MQKTRRQFSIEIVKCDGFIEMGSAAQALYIQLMGSCDDEGFTSQIATCKFMAHASEEDLQELIRKRFVFIIENDGVKVAVIKHWRLNNYFREGQAKPSAFAERAKVYVKPNGNYTLDPQEGQPLSQKKQEPLQKPHAGTPARKACASHEAGAPCSNPIQDTSYPIQSNNNPIQDQSNNNPVERTHEDVPSWMFDGSEEENDD